MTDFILLNLIIMECFSILFMKVYSCGDNAFGQLGHTKTMVLVPKKVKVGDCLIFFT